MISLTLPKQPSLLHLEHFFDAFALEHKRDIRVDAAVALELDSEDILPNLVVEQDVAQQFNSHQCLYRWIPQLKEQRK